jgi:hypothetical protein
MKLKSFLFQDLKTAQSAFFSANQAFFDALFAPGGFVPIPAYCSFYKIDP